MTTGEIMTIFKTFNLRQLLITCLWLSQIGLSQIGLSQIANAASPTPLADKPLFTSYAVPGNVALALSVEYPTALSPSYRDSYATTKEYLGYFDPNKCYYYSNSNINAKYRYFEPMAPAVGHVCNASPASRHWSGNFLNWATSQTIDPFRQVLTGGYRHIDDVGITVLEKAWNSGQSGNVFSKTLPANFVPGATPFKFNLPLITEVDGWGNQIAFAAQGGGAKPSFKDYYPNAINESTAPNGIKVSEDKLYSHLDDSPTNTAQNNLFTTFARIQVCKNSLLEKNCVAYGSNYKPEGLIQKNALKMNFAAFGYLNQDDSYQSGGVLRARMAPLGPMKPEPGQLDKENLNREWDPTTGIFSEHPRPLDEAESGGSASGIVRSGVINYLNNFGQYSANRQLAYMHFDQASELYYAISRYYRNKGNYEPFTKRPNGQALLSSQLDGFPAIKTWDDPLKYSCQQNFVIGLGDTHNSFDARLPGAGGIALAQDKPTPTDDPTTDVKKFTNYIGLAQGYSTYRALGEKFTPWCCPGATFYIAGLAYDLHVSDMRPEIGSDGREIFPGKQTAKTYWLDVLEADSPIDHKDRGEKGMRNQYWLAAKYGGFDVPAGNFNPYDTANPLRLTASQWDTNGDDDPDTYFRANNPKVMQENLTKAFDDILRNLEKSSNSLAVTSRFFTGNDIGYSPSYNVDGWSGDVNAEQITLDPNTGQIASLTNIWSASAKLELRVTPTTDTRTIATGTWVTNTTGGPRLQGVPFRFGSLGSDEKAALEGITKQDESIVSAEDVLNYLRGKKTITNNRKKILGDITVPELLTIAAPNAPYGEARNPGYNLFKDTYKNRAGVVYAPANDGMLHAFAAGAAGGQELFAYVPQALFQGPNNTPKEDGLAALAKPSYIHHAYVNKTPVVQDVNFGGGSDDWHSILVGGLGKGGKAYYALDVTDPSALTAEGALASKVLWEFKHPHMGYSFGVPRMVKTKQHGWVVILTSGYNNDDRKGYFFIVNPKTGELIQKIATPGSDNSDGLANVSTFINDYADYTADAAYAGDLQGNVWRLDLTKTTDNYDPPTLIAKLTNKNGQAQPITTPPVPAIDFNTGKRFVFVGTGRLLDETDIVSNQEQSFYTIIDGTSRNFYTTPTTSPVDFPFTRDNMADNTTVQGASLNSNQRGWFIDLGFAKSNAYRVNVPMKVENGYVLFSANLPDNSDVCNPSGSALRYAFDYSTGISALPNRVAYQKVEGLVESNSMYNSSSSNGTWAATNTGAGGTLKVPDVKLNSTLTTFKVLNWREVNAE
jgi:type IV pilus assembly protein PilY1